jgi:hypothetical protein
MVGICYARIKLDPGFQGLGGSKWALVIRLIGEVLLDGDSRVSKND